MGQPRAGKGTLAWVVANTILYFHDDSRAAVNRWLPFIFDKSFLNKKDPTLKNKFANEFPGITMWALEGLLRLETRGHFELPQVSKDTLANISAESGSIHDFLSSRCCIGSDKRCSDKGLVDAYTQWCIEAGQNPRSRQSFLRAVEDATRGKGVTKKQSIRVEGIPTRGFDGLGLSPLPKAIHPVPFSVNTALPVEANIPPPPPVLKH